MTVPPMERVYLLTALTTACAILVMKEMAGFVQVCHKIFVHQIKFLHKVRKFESVCHVIKYSGKILC